VFSQIIMDEKKKGDALRISFRFEICS